MQRLLIPVLCLATLAATLTAQRGRGRDLQGPELENYTFASGSIDSDKMRRGTARYYVLLPKSYDEDANAERKYPWVLWLPGFGGSGDVLRRGGAQVLDRLSGDKTVDEMALVVFGGRRSTYMNGESAGDTEDLITTELITHLQEKYRLSDQREHRAVMGVSAGGFGALKIALRHPELFGVVAVHSAAILPVDPDDLAGTYERMVNRMIRRGGLGEVLGDPIDKAKWQQHMPLGIVAAKQPADLAGLQIYFDAGSDDRYGFFEPNQELARTMTEHGHKHLFRAVEEGGHAWSSPKMEDNVTISLQFVAAALAGKDAVAMTKARLEKGEDKADEGKADESKAGESKAGEGKGGK